MAYPAYGSFAEYARARTDSISLKPRNITHAQASVLPLVGWCNTNLTFTRNAENVILYCALAVFTPHGAEAAEFGKVGCTSEFLFY